MSTTNHYKKFYKTDRPKPPDSWYPTEIMEQKDTPRTLTPTPTPRMKKIDKGFKRWKALPEPTVMSYLSLVTDNSTIFKQCTL